MWKRVYGEYKEAYSNSVFQKDTLKDYFQNVEGIQDKQQQWRGVWKSGVAKWLGLAQLKVAMDEHATLNVLKR